MKLDIKSVWTICPSTINFVLPFSIFDLPSKLYFCRNVQTRNTHTCVIATQRITWVGCEVSTWLYCKQMSVTISYYEEQSTSELPAKQRKVKHKAYQKWVSNTIATARQSCSKATLQSGNFFFMIGYSGGNSTC